MSIIELLKVIGARTAAGITDFQMINKFIVLGISAAIVLGCTHGSISAVPIHVEGVGEVYRYEGRSNFPHQIKRADELMAAMCKDKNGGHPVVVTLQKRDIGYGAMGSGQATTTFSASTYGTNTYGDAQTSAQGYQSALRNQNQEILFKCITE